MPHSGSYIVSMSLGSRPSSRFSVLDQLAALGLRLDLHVVDAGGGHLERVAAQAHGPRHEAPLVDDAVAHHALGRAAHHRDAGPHGLPHAPQQRSLIVVDGGIDDHRLELRRLELRR